MERKFFFGHTVQSGAENRVAEEFVDAMTAEVLDLEKCQTLGSEVLSIITHELRTATDDEIFAIAERGRGADFSALRLFFSPEADDYLRLHVYPRDTSDGGYHHHTRTVVSTLATGRIANHTASAEMCDPGYGDPELEVWDCKMVEGRCTPAPNTEVAARLSEIGTDVIKGGNTYTVPTDIYHTVSVEGGTATLCLFTASGMCDRPIIGGRLIKPKNSPLEPILPMDTQAINEIRSAIL